MGWAGKRVNPVRRSSTFQWKSSQGALNPLLAAKRILSSSPLQAAGLSNGVKDSQGSSRVGRFPVMVIAHRGFSGEAPENTLAAFKKAIDVGSDMMELDVHFSKDGQVVVIHDDHLERTTNGWGKVADHTLQELKKLDAGSWFGPLFSGERIPSLKEVLELARKKIFVNIEIKNGYLGSYTISDLADRTLQEVQRRRMVNQVIFSSFDLSPLERVKERNFHARVALLYHHRWNIPQEITGGRPFSLLNLRRSFLTKDKIAKVHLAGMELNTYTVNSAKEMEQFVRWGIDGIITNHPDRLIHILQKKFS
jgi:glycerophosphoryl diester phosphodiesterase